MKPINVLGLVALSAVAYAVAVSLPDLKRYWRIHTM